MHCRLVQGREDNAIGSAGDDALGRMAEGLQALAAGIRHLPASSRDNPIDGRESGLTKGLEVQADPGRIGTFTKDVRVTEDFDIGTGVVLRLTQELGDQFRAYPVPVTKK
jgi:hypothetical protein